MSAYYIMSTQYAYDYYLESVATYDDGRWTISGDAPKDFTGEIVDLSQSEMTIEEFVSLIDTMRAEQPTGRLLIIPIWAGRWLHKNHEAFKPKTEAPQVI